MYSGVRCDCCSRPSRTGPVFCTRSLGFGFPARLSLSLSISSFSLSLNYCSFCLFIASSTAFLIYVGASVLVVLLLIVYLEPLYGQTNILVYLGICSILGAITVISCLDSVLLCLKESPLSPHAVFRCRIGYECKGNRDCNQTHLGGNESIRIEPDLVFPFGCSVLSHNTVELSE